MLEMVLESALRAVKKAWYFVDAFYAALGFGFYAGIYSAYVLCRDMVCGTDRGPTLIRAKLAELDRLVSSKLHHDA